MFELNCCVGTVVGWNQLDYDEQEQWYDESRYGYLGTLRSLSPDGGHVETEVLRIDEEYNGDELYYVIWLTSPLLEEEAEDFLLISEEDFDEHFARHVRNNDIDSLVSRRYIINFEVDYSEDEPVVTIHSVAGKRGRVPKR